MNWDGGMRTSKMGLVTKIVKYGTIFAVGYYLGSCSPNIQHLKTRKEVVKYEQKIAETKYKPGISYKKY